MALRLRYGWGKDLTRRQHTLLGFTHDPNPPLDLETVSAGGTTHDGACRIHGVECVDVHRVSGAGRDLVIKRRDKQQHVQCCRGFQCPRADWGRRDPSAACRDGPSFLSRVAPALDHGGPACAQPARRPGRLAVPGLGPGASSPADP